MNLFQNSNDVAYYIYHISEQDRSYLRNKKKRKKIIFIFAVLIPNFIISITDLGSYDSMFTYSSQYTTLELNFSFII